MACRHGKQFSLSHSSRIRTVFWKIKSISESLLVIHSSVYQILTKHLPSGRHLGERQHEESEIGKLFRDVGRPSSGSWGLGCREEGGIQAPEGCVLSGTELGLESLYNHKPLKFLVSSETILLTSKYVIISFDWWLSGKESALIA